MAENAFLDIAKCCTSTNVVVTRLGSATSSHLQQIIKRPMIMRSPFAIFTSFPMRMPAVKVANYCHLPTGFPLISGGWLKELPTKVFQILPKDSRTPRRPRAEILQQIALSISPQRGKQPLSGVVVQKSKEGKVTQGIKEALGGSAQAVCECLSAQGCKSYFIQRKI